MILGSEYNQVRNNQAPDNKQGKWETITILIDYFYTFRFRFSSSIIHFHGIY